MTTPDHSEDSARRASVARRPASDSPQRRASDPVSRLQQSAGNAAVVQLLALQRDQKEDPEDAAHLFQG